MRHGTRNSCGALCVVIGPSQAFAAAAIDTAGAEGMGSGAAYLFCRPLGHCPPSLSAMHLSLQKGAYATCISNCLLVTPCGTHESAQPLRHACTLWNLGLFTCFPLARGIRRFTCVCVCVCVCVKGWGVLFEREGLKWVWVRNQLDMCMSGWWWLGVGGVSREWLKFEGTGSRPRLWARDNS